MTNPTSSELNAMFGFNKTNTNTSSFGEVKANTQGEKEMNNSNTVINEDQASSFGEVKANNTQEVKEMTNSNLGYEMNEVVEHVKIGASVVGIWATATVVDSATVLGCAFGMSLQGGAGAVSLGNGFVPLIAVGNLLLASAVATAPVVLCGFVLSPLVASVFPNTIASLLNVEVEPTAWKAVAEARTKEILINLGYEEEEGREFAKLLINPEGWAKENVVISPIPIIFDIKYATPVVINSVAMYEKIFNFKVYGNTQGVSELVVRYNSEAISWGGKTYNFNKNIIEVIALGADEYYFNQSSPVKLIKSVLETLETKTHLKAAQTFLSGLIGTVIITEWETSLANPNSYNYAAIVREKDVNLVDAQQVIRQNEVVAYHVDETGHILIKTERDNSGVWVEGCLEAANKFFGLTFPDKTNTKRGFCGDALIVLGIAQNEGNTYSVVDADKEGKLFNRHAMVKHIAAEFPQGAVSRDFLLSEISDGKFAFSAGIVQSSLYLFSNLLSLAVGDGGFVARSPITYISNKRIEGSINLDNLFTANAEYKAEVIKAVGTCRKAQLAFVIKNAKETLLNDYAGVSIAPNQSLSFKGQDIARNNSEVAIVLSNQAPLTVSEGVALNTEIRTIDCSFSAKAIVVDYNYKARGQWFKGMATRNDAVVVKGSDTDVIFCPNSDKNTKITLIRMWASANNRPVAFCKDGEFRFVKINAAGLYETDELINFDEVLADINANLVKSLEVSLEVAPTELSKFKEAKPEAFTNVKETALENGNIRIEFSCEGIEADLVYAVELSSVEENFAAGRKLPPIQAELLTTFVVAKSLAARKIQEHSAKIARTIKIAGSNKVDARYNEANCDVWIEIFNKANKSNNPKDAFLSLAKQFPNGVKISGDVAGKRQWSVSIPFHVISVLGAFKKHSGYSFDDTINNTYAFLCLLADKNSDAHLIADYAFSIGAALDGWKSDVVKNKKAFTKGTGLFKTHGMKVLANGTAGYEMHNGVSIPVILVDESNPLAKGTAVDKNGEALKAIKDGDVVFFYRNPMVDLTPAIVRITKGQSVCGAFTCAVSPSILAWSSQTDNDGDVLWLVPANQVGVANINSDKVIDGRYPSQAVASLMSHPLIQDTKGLIAEAALKAAKCDDLYSGIIKQKASVVSLHPTKLLAIDLVNEAERVANHYRIRVGQGYSAMFNAYSSFIRKYNKGETISTEELLGIKICSFVLYEEWGLAGYSAGNEANFKDIYDMAKQQLGVAKPTSASIGFGRQKVAKSALDYAAGFLAQQIVQSKVEKNPHFAKGEAIREEALSTALFRTLTKGAFALNGKTISNVFANATVDANSNYAEALIVWQSFASSGLVIQ